MANQREAGVLVTLEGGEGAGKSTHARILAHALEDAGYEVVRVREPGGTPLGEALRALLLDPANANMAPETELFLYEAARAQIIAEVIRPALARGAVVVCDRFTDSTLAYQGAGRGLDQDFIRAANRFACAEVEPALTVVLEAAPDARESAAEGLARALTVGEADRLELAGTAFHERVSAAFARLAAEASASDDPAHIASALAAAPAETIRSSRAVVAVSSQGSVAHTARAVAEALAPWFPNLGNAQVEAALMREGD